MISGAVLDLTIFFPFISRDTAIIDAELLGFLPLAVSLRISSLSSSLAITTVSATNS